MKRNIIHSEDCIEGLKRLPDNSIDLIITDPPYMISRTNQRIKIKNRINVNLDYGEWDKFRNIKEYFKFTENWFKECIRVLKPKGWMYLFFDRHKLGFLDLYLSKKYRMKVKTIFSWLKSNPYPAFKTNWLSASELIWIGCKQSGNIKNYLSHPEMFNYMITPNKSIYGETSHPNEKPKALIERFVKASSNACDTMLDPFVGSGTIPVVCKSLSRNYIGFESNKEFYNIAVERISKTKSGELL